MSGLRLEEAWENWEKWATLDVGLRDGREGPPIHPDHVAAARHLLYVAIQEMMPPKSHTGVKTALERRYVAMKSRIGRLGR
jgi:hypothetical protein